MESEWEALEWERYCLFAFRCLLFTLYSFRSAPSFPPLAASESRNAPQFTWESESEPDLRSAASATGEFHHLHHSIAYEFNDKVMKLRVRWKRAQSAMRLLGRNGDENISGKWDCATFEGPLMESGSAPRGIPAAAEAANSAATLKFDTLLPRWLPSRLTFVFHQIIHRKLILISARGTFNITFVSVRVVSLFTLLLASSNRASRAFRCLFFDSKMR